ncbi:MAG: PQQ-like beta-propeller repeat protein, partial [Planctomycetales bacterium]
MDRLAGQPLWSNESPPLDSRGRRMFHVPLGDPVLADGLLHYLQWNAEGDVNSSRDRRVSLVCFDPRRQARVWEHTLVQAGRSADLTASLERARPETAVYGNRVTVHQGAIYSSSNCGFAARSDARDGRTDWIYYYPTNADRRNSKLALKMADVRQNVWNHGSPPVVAGDQVIFMPRDASRIFALDQRTGRLAWDNPFVLGVQLVGEFQDLLIVRGRKTVAGLELKTGETRWTFPLDDPVLGRAELIGSSVYLAQSKELLCLDAKQGRLKETRPWELKGERPWGFTIRGQDLYVVTDKPGQQPGRETGLPLNPSASSSSPLKLPLRRAWVLSRKNATVIPAPPDSELHGAGFVLSQGMIECIDVSARGGSRWRRFLDAHDPSLHFVGKTLLVTDRVPNERDRVVAFDATDGRVLWERVLAKSLQETITCGSHQIFHDSRGRMLAIDLAEGKRAWERNLGIGRLMTLHWDGDRLHVFCASANADRPRRAYHFQLDARSGQSLGENAVEFLMGN